jgi:deoxyadenosine/deoxycytidine kinase
VNGLLVEPGDAPALTAALQRMIDDDALRARLAERGRESVEHLRIDRYWEALREVYHRAQGSCEALRPRRLEGAEVSAHAEDRASSPHSERE